MSVRVRIAPSPTGAPHVGTAYIGIFNLAFARQNQGQFVLRIEDTDRTRSEPQYETMIFESLRWLGLQWDEGPDVGGPHGPYRQSERSDIYQKHADILLERGTAYRCFCTAERLDQVREAQKAAKQNPMYDRHCRHLPAEEVKRQLDEGKPYVIRLAVPPEGDITFTDLIRGDITIANSTLDDQVLMKSDGFPTYHLANVVDDHLMGITHVMRAEEWISSTPKHVLLYQAFGWEAPRFGHMPLLRNADRSKISKRKNPVSLKWYEEEGYLPEAMVNFLALMGFSVPEDKEDNLSLADVTGLFSFDKINPAGPVFDLEKLGWLNGVYMRRLPPAELRRRLLAFSPQYAGVEHLDEILALTGERMKKLKDFGDIADYFFADPKLSDPTLLVPKKRTAAETAPVLQRIADALDAMPADAWNKETVEARIREISDELGWAAKESFMAVRVAITGRTATPPLIESMLILGREKSAHRLREAATGLLSPA
jgi:glutamyl-tRNA synthetase